MKFGIAFANTGPYVAPEAAATIGTAAEQAGFDSLWTVEHVVVPREYASTYPYSGNGKMPGGSDFDIPDPLIWLTWVAARTTTLRLGTGVVILPQRNPVILAKEVATLDMLSGGRVELGVGIGWLEEEFDILGASFPDRARRTEEYIEAMRALWSQDAATFAGETVTFAEAISRPRPVDRRVPVHIGGHSPAAARRAGRVGDGFFPAKGDVPTLVGEMRKAPEGAPRSSPGARCDGERPAAAGGHHLGALVRHGPALERKAHLLGLGHVVAHQVGGHAGTVAVAPGHAPVAAPSPGGDPGLLDTDLVGQHQQHHQLSDHAVLDDLAGHLGHGHVDGRLAGQEPLRFEHLLGRARRGGEGGGQGLVAPVGEYGVHERFAQRVGGADQVDQDQR